MATAVLEVGESSFDTEVLQADQPVIVDFWAAWCGPCLMMAPVFEELAGQYGDQMKFVKVDVDNNQQLAARYGIMSIPTLIIFKNGEPVEQIIGFRGKDHLEQVIQRVIN